MPGAVLNVSGNSPLTSWCALSAWLPQPLFLKCQDCSWTSWYLKGRTASRFTTCTSKHFSGRGCSGEGRTVTAALHVLQRGVTQCIMGLLQLLTQSAQIPLRFGPYDAQLRVDVLVFIGCIFFILWWDVSRSFFNRLHQI